MEFCRKNADCLHGLSYNMKILCLLLCTCFDEIWHVYMFCIQFSTHLNLYKKLAYHIFILLVN